MQYFDDNVQYGFFSLCRQAGINSKEFGQIIVIRMIKKRLL